MPPAGRRQCTCLTLGAWMWLFCGSCSGADRSWENSLRIYQEQLVSETSSLRPGWHSYKGYSGPWIESAFFLEWLNVKPKLSRIYLPVAWTDCMHTNRLKAEMQEFISGLKPEFKYFTILQADRGFNHEQLQVKVPANIDLILFSSGGDSPPLRTIPIPLLKEELQPDGHAKTISVSFQASIANHPIRQALNMQYQSEYLFLGDCSDWKLITESSNFSFCPRGYGTTSFRLYETLQLGTIPIYIWQDEKWLPFQQIIDWEEFAIIVEGRDISQIPAKLAQADIPRMKAAIDKYRHMFTYNFTFKYMVDHFIEGSPLYMDLPDHHHGDGVTFRRDINQ